ncbi:hypothetical protein [Photobacterium alginatilyticum]|uniref:Uncharacterized protein n=1 Tax=Photobacterium alginatilyticum TaxID=1775171 RepID=A0ABW9YLF7_9GAMM|nr:hypothetical protein [Photobacterium alginatilyticum]NBI54628.1 hypothetical protein [Photobacterium alginatilyticum]
MIGTSRFDVPAKHYTSIENDELDYDKNIIRNSLLKSLFHHSPVIHKRLRKHVLYINSHFSHDSYFKYLAEELNKSNRPILPLEAFLYDEFKAQGGNFDIINDRLFFKEMIFSFLFSSYLNKKYSVPTLFTAHELYFIKQILSSDNFTLFEQDNYLSQRLETNNSHELIKGALDLSNQPEKIAQITLPDLSKFIYKEKAKPIYNRLLSLFDKHDNLTEADLLYELMSIYKDTAFKLCPGIKDIVVSVLSNVPSSLLFNPIGLYGSGQLIKNHFQTNDDTSFLISMKKLSKLNYKGRTLF